MFDVTNNQNYNKYTYVLNNPLRYTDPTGNVPKNGLSQALTPGGLSHIGFYDTYNEFRTQTAQDFKSQIPYSINFHPYYLKQYNSRWFVFGYNELTKNQYWNMALDRIKQLKLSPKKYIETDVDWEDYFYDLIGVTKKLDDKVQTVRLWFSPILVPYVITKPIHATQKGINTENGLEVTIKVILNYELEKLILSFGSNVKVISPESLKDNIFNQIKNTLRNYQ